MIRATYTLLFILLSIASNAQGIAMADKLRESGKIYAVVAVIALIFIGIVLFLWRIDRKVSKLEKNSK